MSMRGGISWIRAIGVVAVAGALLLPAASPVSAVDAASAGPAVAPPPPPPPVPPPPPPPPCPECPPPQPPACTVTTTTRTWDSHYFQGFELEISRPGVSWEQWMVIITPAFLVELDLGHGWNADWSQEGTLITATSFPWNGELTFGGDSAHFGHIGSFTGSFGPDSFTLQIGPHPDELMTCPRFSA